MTVVDKGDRLEMGDCFRITSPTMDIGTRWGIELLQTLYQKFYDIEIEEL